ncbi:MAG: NAD(P)-dependent oxidoreductase [Coriobacteriia bacterium]|nr:NAD(P)-dependent oxidoreductase [Coriobacteriia bacterium]
MSLGPGSVVGFVGTGVMGAAMAGHLIDAGYSLRVHNRTASKAEPLVEAGATWCETPGETADGADAVITMVGYPSDVEQVYLAPGGLLDHAGEGAVLIDMTTSTPSLAVRLAEAGEARGVPVLDAPVSGGDVGARNAKLTIMAGGDPVAFAAVEAMLRVLGPNVILQGGPGAGQHTKMANQIAIADTILGVCESLAYAEAAGLDPQSVLDSIGAGSAGSWQLANYAPRMLGGDFAPGFYVKHFIKDMRIACDEAGAMGVDLPGLALVLRLFEELADAGHENDGIHALYLLYKGRGVPVV